MSSFIYFDCVRSLRLCRLSLVTVVGLLSGYGHRLLIALASLVAEHRVLGHYRLQ